MAKPKCKTCASGVAHTFTHDLTGYTFHGCRCDDCKTAMSEYQRKRRQKVKEGWKPDTFVHGLSGYTNYRCQCEICLEAKRLDSQSKYNGTTLCPTCADAREAWDDPTDPHGWYVNSHPVPHGTPSGYMYHRCRCPECTAANRALTPRSCPKCERGESHEFVHGDWAYHYHQCRCNLCTAEATRALYDRTEPQDRKAWRAKFAAYLKEIPDPRRRAPWLPVEDAAVMSEEHSLEELCWMLGRSYSSVAHRRQVLRERNVS